MRGSVSAEKAGCISCFHRKAHSVALGNLWRHFERDLRLVGRIYLASGYERYSIWTRLAIALFSNFRFAAKSYLARREEDPAAVVCLGDSAYHRSSVKGELGLGLPVPQRNDGVQQKVKIFTCLGTRTDVIDL